MAVDPCYVRAYADTSTEELRAELALYLAEAEAADNPIRGALAREDAELMRALITERGEDA